MNALAQALSSGKVKAEDVLKAAATAYATAGASLANTTSVNVGAEGMVSWARNDSAKHLIESLNPPLSNIQSENNPEQFERTQTENQ